MPGESQERESRLIQALVEFSRQLEGTRIADYVDLLNRPGRLIYLNFLSGVARGLGFAVGATILGAVLLYVLQRSFVTNLPVIGNFIAEIVKIVVRQLETR